MLPKKKIKTGLDDILKAVTETHRRGYNQPPTGYNQVNQPQPQGGELQNVCQVVQALSLGLLEMVGR